MRDRLGTMIDKAIRYADTHYGGRPIVNGVYTRLMADHLLAEGVIVPKVKIGDKLYAINAARTRVKEYAVTHLEMYECGVKIFGRPIYCREEYWLCWNQDLGNDERCVFLTRELAEKALERSENGK